MQARDFSQRNFPQIVTAPFLTFCSWFCENHVRSTLSNRVGRQGDVHSELYRWSIQLVLECQKNIFIDFSQIAAYLCDMPRLTLDARLRAIGMLQEVRPKPMLQIDLVSKTHCLIPVDILPRYRINTRPAAFWTATCDVTEAGCVHQGRGFAQ